MRFSRSLFAGVLLACALPAHALLKVGSEAPGIELPAAQAGNTTTFSLAKARAQGPVVVYFFPAAYTSGCSLETKLFADAMDDFKAAHATVVGVSGDDIEKLQRFSVSHCRSRFPVASDIGLKVAKSYDATGALSIVGYASRVSYVIAPDGKILMAHADMGPRSHIEESLAAVKAWQAAHPAP